MIERSSTDADQVVSNAGQEVLPPPAEWSAAAVRLLQGVIYNDDNLEVWESLLRNTSPVGEFFAKLGLQLVVDEANAMAYLRQPDGDEIPADYESVPRLFRRSQLSYDTALLCVLLRDELRIYEEEDVQNERCVVAQNDLLTTWRNFFPSELDDVKLNRSLTAGLRKLEELKFVRQFEKDRPSWEIRRIIKARLPLSELEQLRASLVAAVEDAAKPGTNSEGPMNDSAEDETRSEVGPSIVGSNQSNTFEHKREEAFDSDANNDQPPNS